MALLKKIFIGLLVTIIYHISYHTKCISLNNQQCTTKLTLINLHPKEFVERLLYYPFACNLDRCPGNCNAFNDLSSNIVCVPNKTEHLNLNDFNMITGINE